MFSSHHASNFPLLLLTVFHSFIHLLKLYLQVNMTDLIDPRRRSTKCVVKTHRNFHTRARKISELEKIALRPKRIVTVRQLGSIVNG